MSTAVARHGDEVAAVRLWRFDQFVGLGFSEIEAAVLAFSGDVDLELVRRMRSGGCPCELVLQIVF